MRAMVIVIVLPFPQLVVEQVDVVADTVLVEDATLLRGAGVDIADIQESLGHKSPKTTQRYAMVGRAREAGCGYAARREGPGAVAWSE
jgi:hypothetical protein